MTRIIAHFFSVAIALQLLLSALVIQAQSKNKTALDEHVPKRVISKIEVLIGPNLILAYGSDFLKETRNAKFGIRSTLGLVHTFDSRFALDLKISYENKGLKFTTYSENPGPPATDKLINDVTLNYVTATLLPKYTVVPKLKIEFGIGPYSGYLVSTRLKQKLYFKDALVSKYSARPGPDIGYKRFDFGFAFLVGTNLIIDDRTDLTIQFLYSLGLANINEPMIDRLRNNTWSLLIGFSRKRKSYL